MPNIYYTQEEVDEIIEKKNEEIQKALQNKFKADKREMIREFILYDLSPSELTAKQLREKLLQYTQRLHD